MNTSTPASAGAAAPQVAPPGVPAPRRVGLGCTIGLVFIAAMIIGVMTVVVAAVRSVRLGAEAGNLRDAVRAHFEAHGTWDPVVEVRLGPVLCGLGREFVIAAADDPDATAVLRAARAVQVGVYHVTDGANPAGVSRYVREATAAMAGGGWSPVVTVVGGTTSVLVFMPADASTKPGDEIECGVVVRDDSDLVIAVVRIGTRPLLRLIERHAFRDLAVERP